LGELTYTLAGNANGSATVTVAIKDDGGTSDGGVDQSDGQTFTITVTPVNDAPSFAGSNQTALEDSGAQTVTGWAMVLSAGPADESAQTLSFGVSNDNNTLFSTQPAVSTGGVLTFTPAANANGTAVITVTIQDNGGVANGGDNDSVQTFNIDVTAVNDVPSFTKGANQTVVEDPGAQSLAWPTRVARP
jgi:hypothetical protein